jgi:hypothetical protein
MRQRRARATPAPRPRRARANTAPAPTCLPYRPWHGTMFIRRATSSELVADGEFVVSYVDAMMSDKKEDGFATLSAIYLALKQYKQNNLWITHVAAKTDGAGAYAGIVFTVGASLTLSLTRIRTLTLTLTLPLTLTTPSFLVKVGLSMMAELVGICVTDHYIGESGKNKTTLDGHFGVKGSQASSHLPSISSLQPYVISLQPHATTCNHVQPRAPPVRDCCIALGAATDCCRAQGHHHPRGPLRGREDDTRQERGRAVFHACPSARLGPRRQVHLAPERDEPPHLRVCSQR